MISPTALSAVSGSAVAWDLGLSDNKGPRELQNGSYISGGMMLYIIEGCPNSSALQSYVNA